ncbi:hypothetical protein JXR93_05910 [bacterium]|nr:hypothetical protein [bacterium]
MKKTVFLFTILSIFLLSCSKNSSPKITTNEKKIEKRVDSPVFEDRYFTISTEIPKSIKSGEKLSFKIDTKARGGHHINVDFPISLSFDDGCFDFGNKKFKKTDSKTTETGIIFELNGVCSQIGSQKVSGVLNFGHCTDEICATEKLPFNFNVIVE